MRPIDADALIAKFPHDEDWDYPVNTNSYVVEAINSAPSIDIEPKRGEWVDEHENGHGYWVGTCNQCGKENCVDNFCPNCGARMKGADDE